MKFDVVMGNPPYNEVSRSKKHATKQKGARNLWIYFFEHFSTRLASNGYVAFVTPNHWLRDSNKIKKRLLCGKIVWAEISDIKQYFPNTGSTFTAWVWSPNPGSGHNVLCNGERIDVMQKLIPLSVHATKDDWEFLSRKFDRIPITWTRTSTCDNMVTPCIVVERASPMKRVYVWDGKEMPRGDWYYHNFENKDICNDVLDFLLSDDGQRIFSLVRSGMAMTHVINKVPVLSVK
jgi:hypothetical protein